VENAKIAAGLKIAAQPESDPAPEDLAFIRQMGVEHVVLWASGDKACYEYYMQQRRIFEDAGLSIYALGNRGIHVYDAIALNLPGRDEAIRKYKRHIRDLGRAGIPYTTHAQMGNGVWCSAPEQTRGGAETRALNLDGEACGLSPHGSYDRPLSHGRKYSEEEIWDNYEHFVREIAPVAEEAGVKVGIHTDDPPVPELAGVPRCFHSFDSCRRAMEIADSPNIGLCLCVGCWLEGGDAMGKDVIETIRCFGEQRKLFKVHLRNVNRPLPYFVETFLDDGYMDMSRVMLALREVDFDGVIIPDHVPLMANDHRVGMAFTIGYMKALAERAEAEYNSR
jgi:mannonate dehydratase